MKGVLTVVKRGEEYALASDGLIQELQHKQWTASNDFAVGKRVITKDTAGSYKNIEATVHAIGDDHYILRTIKNGKIFTMKANMKDVEAA